MLLNDSIASCISKNDKKAWCAVTDLLNGTNDFLLKNPKLVKGYKFRCHSLCDALAANISGLRVVDGYYLGLSLKKSSRRKENFSLVKSAHSWLITSNLTIIDPYPVGSLNLTPLLIPARGKYKDFGYSFYFPDLSVGKDVRKRWLWVETARWKSIMRKARSLIQK